MTTNEPLTPTPVSEWKKDASGGGLLHDVTLPSGKVAQCRRVGMETFLKLGLIPNSLASIVQRQISKAQLGRETSEQEVEQEMMELLEDPSKLTDIIQLADDVLLVCCVQPKVAKPPEDPLLRKDDVVYTDEVDFEDKMFIFSWAVGGAEQAATFRQQLAGDVAAVESVPGVGGAPQPTA